MAAQIVTEAELSREIGKSRQAIAKARKAGRLTPLPDGRYDLAVAKIQWEENRQRRPARPTVEAGSELADETSPSGSGSDYWAHKTRREAAEAQLAELKLAEMAGTLVLRENVNRTSFLAARVMRDQMLAIAPRLAATLATVNDPQLIEIRIGEEVRVALAGFAQVLRSGGLPDVSDGQPG